MKPVAQQPVSGTLLDKSHYFLFASLTRSKVLMKVQYLNFPFVIRKQFVC